MMFISVLKPRSLRSLCQGCVVEYKDQVKLPDFEMSFAPRPVKGFFQSMSIHLRLRITVSTHAMRPGNQLFLYIGVESEPLASSTA